jgi:hypothetical protein
MEARRPVWEWMAAAFCTALALAIGAMAVVLVTQHRLRIGPGLEVTARFAFLFFWPAYVGGALTSLFGDAFLPLRTQASRGRPRRDGEMEGLQPRLPSPAQRAPTARRPPLNRIEERRARRLGSSPSGTGWRLYRRRAVHAHQDAAARPPKWQRGTDGVDAPPGVASAPSRPDMHERRQT